MKKNFTFLLLLVIIIINFAPAQVQTLKSSNYKTQDNTPNLIPSSATISEEPVESAYSLDYLNLMLKQTGNVDITIRFSKDYPLEITGLLNSDILAKYVLAPRIINED